MPIDREIFFDEMNNPFPLGDTMTNILNMVLDEYGRRDPIDPRFMAYVMGTIIHDTWRLDTSSEDATRRSIKEMMSKMIEGSYTGHALDEFFTLRFSAWQLARAVIQPDMTMDYQVGVYGKKVHAAVDKAMDVSMPYPPAVTLLPPPDIGAP